MKRYRATYDEWKCIIEKKRIGKTINDSNFNGYIGLLNIKRVTQKQVWKYNEMDMTVCDNGYQWLTIIPKDEFYCITVMMNSCQEIVVSYIDIIDSQGIDSDGVPYFYDIYLDLVVYPDGSILVDDMDELENALTTKDITKEQYLRTLEVSKQLQEGILKRKDRFKEYISQKLLYFLK